MTLTPIPDVSVSVLQIRVGELVSWCYGRVSALAVQTERIDSKLGSVSEPQLELLC